MIQKIKNIFKAYAPDSAIKAAYSFRRYRRSLYRRLFLRADVYKNSFVREILKQYWKDYKSDLHPIDRRMCILEERKVSGMNTENIRFFINELVRRFAKNGTYMEVGVFQGNSLLSAALFNPSTRCIGIDNFFEFNSPLQDNENILKENLRKFNHPPNIEYYNMDYHEAFKQVFLKEPDLKIDVYYYDGAHDYDNQLNGLRMALPHLSEKCVILVDDINRKKVEEANARFIQENAGFLSALRIKTIGNCSEDWWDGFQVITRNI